MPTTGPFPRHPLGFICLRSEDYELYQNFDDTELKKIRPYIQQ